MALIISGPMKNKNVKVRKFHNRQMFVRGLEETDKIMEVDPKTIGLRIEEYNKMKLSRSCGVFWRIFIAYFDSDLMLYRLKQIK